VPDWLLFVVSSLVWGTTWLTIKLQLGVVAPAASVAYRFGAASLVLFAWCAVRRVDLRFDARAHAGLAVLGALQFALNYLLIYASEAHLASGLVAVVFGTVVLWNILGSRLFLRVPVPPPVVYGACVGMLGVALVFAPEMSRLARAGAAGDAPLGVALAIAGSVSAAAGSLWSQRMYARGGGVVASSAWSMLYGAVIVALYCVARGTPFRFDPSPAYVLSLAYLAIFGSVVAFLAYFTLLQRIGAARASYTAVATPVLAMITSTVFEGYRWTALAASGMVLVLVGNVMVLRGKQAAAAPRRDAPASPGVEKSARA